MNTYEILEVESPYLIEIVRMSDPRGLQAATKAMYGSFQSSQSGQMEMLKTIGCVC
jgi:hypothetical protein